MVEQTLRSSRDAERTARMADLLNTVDPHDSGRRRIVEASTPIGIVLLSGKCTQE